MSDTTTREELLVSMGEWEEENRDLLAAMEREGCSCLKGDLCSVAAVKAAYAGTATPLQQKLLALVQLAAKKEEVEAEHRLAALAGVIFGEPRGGTNH